MYRDNSGNNWYKVGLHIHTTLSDGDLSPEAVCRKYKAAGFDAIAITDHWIYHSGGEIEGLKIISGCEYNFGAHDTTHGGVMHIVGFGTKSDPCLSMDMSRQEIIDGINSKDGFAVLAHPAWSLNTIDDIKPLKGFFATEIYNTVSGVHQSVRAYSGYIVDIMANENVIYNLLATDDAHYYDGTDDTVSFVMVNAESGEVSDILKAIREEKFYSSQGPHLIVKRDGDTIAVSSSPCSLISFISNSSWERDRAVRGENLTEALYTIKPYDKWVRVEVKDKDGNYAWSNIIKI